jgi:DNA-binding NarL/FixJ family response regulator
MKILYLLFMDKTSQISVMVIENDEDFRELLDGIFERSELFELVGSYESLEEFGVALLQQKSVATWIPELMVVDVMSSTDPRTEGASFMSALRAEGLDFATLLVSSMDFGALLRVLRKSQPSGWAALQKTSRLTEEQIIEAALSVCRETGST